MNRILFWTGSGVGAGRIEAPKRLLAASLTLCSLAGAATVAPAEADSSGLKMPASPPPYRARTAEPYQRDVLLVMPRAGMTDEEIIKACEEDKCEVIGSVGSGAYRVVAVRTPRGKGAQTELLLKKDKSFFAVQRNYSHGSATNAPNDPDYPGDTFLSTLDVPKAWSYTMGAGQSIAIFDSGAEAQISELASKTDKGYDATTVDAKVALALSSASALAGPLLGPVGIVGGILGSLGISGLDGAVNRGASHDEDPNAQRCHGTTVSCTAGAAANNGKHGCGVAPQARIYPVKIMNGSGTADDLAIIAGLWHVISTNGPKIMNLSYDGKGYDDPGSSPIVHTFFRMYHDVYGGIIFVAAGNDGVQLNKGQISYLNIVSAVDNTNTLASFSNYGNCVTFTAPGTAIKTDSKADQTVTVSGTSYSAPMCAGIAALTWAANPSLKNTDVEFVMKMTCKKPDGTQGLSPYYGFGLPDANAAIQMAANR